jgi:hypothetical protein
MTGGSGGGGKGDATGDLPHFLPKTPRKAIPCRMQLKELESRHSSIVLRCARPPLKI